MPQHWLLKTKNKNSPCTQEEERRRVSSEGLLWNHEPQHENFEMSFCRPGRFSPAMWLLHCLLEWVLQIPTFLHDKSNEFRFWFRMQNPPPPTSRGSSAKSETSEWVKLDAAQILHQQVHWRLEAA